MLFTRKLVAYVKVGFVRSIETDELRLATLMLVHILTYVLYDDTVSDMHIAILVLLLLLLR